MKTKVTISPILRIENKFEEVEIIQMSVNTIDEENKNTCLTYSSTTVKGEDSSLDGIESFVMAYFVVYPLF